MGNPGTQRNRKNVEWRAIGNVHTQSQRNGWCTAMHAAARDTAIRAARAVRTVATRVRDVTGFRRAAMIDGHGHAVRHLPDSLRVLASRRAAHGEEREQASKKKTTQKTHATQAED